MPENFRLMASSDACPVQVIQHESLPYAGVQYHPESSPGPHDSRYLFNKFIDLIEGNVLA